MRDRKIDKERDRPRCNWSMGEGVPIFKDGGRR
jgi:hypothetical protein